MLPLCPTLKVEHLNLAKGVNIIKRDTIAYLMIVYSWNIPIKTLIFKNIIMLRFILKYCQKNVIFKVFQIIL
jgi:hypothetical protein